MPHSHADLCRTAASAIDRLPAAATPAVLVGFDGFVDNIIDVVATRTSRTSYAAVPTIAEFGGRISAAAGKSANVELVVKQSKIGGNGPIMANALAAYAARVTAVGVLGGSAGGSAVDPVFTPLADRAERIISLGPPAVTDALEFHDGKVMVGKLLPLEAVSYDTLVEACGGIEGLKALFRSPVGIATVNWTMTLEMTAIWERLASDILPGLRPDRPKWFIDLADPAKRTREDLLKALTTMRQLQRHVDVVLGLNEMECRQVLDVLGLRWEADARPEWEQAEAGCVALRATLGLSVIMCHLVKSSACAFADATGAAGSASANGFFEAKPLITTGAGDHFNAGFFFALLNGVPHAQALQIGGATSGHYVRTAQSPTRAQAAAFLRQAAG